MLVYVNHSVLTHTNKSCFHSKSCTCLIVYYTVVHIQLGMSVLCKYAIDAYFAYCRIFFAYFSKVRISHIFSHKSTFATAICVSITCLLRFFTSIIWLPTEWHHPYVRTPVEQDGGSWFQAMLYHISTAYLVSMRSTYFFKCHINLTCLYND